MHELSIMGEVVRIVERVAMENRLEKVDTVVLQVGELTPIVPHFLEEYYPAVTYKTSLEGTKLRVEMVPGIARCNDCGKVFNVVEHDGVCPQCSGSAYEIISGRDFLLKEILAC